jgi:hypothetical protein
MITKTLGTIIIVFICILMFPVAFAIVGGAFGIVIGVLGAVFGAVMGVIGGVFGAIFGFFGWLFEGLFGWGWHFDWPFRFFNCNIFTLAAIVLVIALVARSKSKRP